MLVKLPFVTAAVSLQLCLANLAIANVIYFRSADGLAPPPGNASYIKCYEGTNDPICKMIRKPKLDVMETIYYPNGTKEDRVSKYTREQLKEIREKNKVASVQRYPGEKLPSHEDIIANITKSHAKRESAPPICISTVQKWYDQSAWGYWYQAWKQVGNCFYCDTCSEAIAVGFSVSQTWTYGLSVNFNDVITASFGFSWGQTYSLTDTRTCQWSSGQQYGCHSIWYQPLMSWHNGYANYQTHTHCSAGQGLPASDSYYDHNWAYAHVDQGANGGVNQGNLGCDSGCQGNDHRQCWYGNNGGSLWPYSN